VSIIDRRDVCQVSNAVSRFVLFQSLIFHGFLLFVISCDRVLK